MPRMMSRAATAPMRMMWRLVEELIAAVKFLAEPAAGYSPGDGLIAFRLELAVYLPHNLVGL